MLEMTHSGAEHSDAALICLLDRILVAYASARLYDSLHAVLCRKGHSVVEWEETVRTEYESLSLDVLTDFSESRRSLFECYLGRTHTIHLTGTEAL